MLASHSAKRGVCRATATAACKVYRGQDVAKSVTHLCQVRAAQAPAPYAVTHAICRNGLDRVDILVAQLL